MLREVCCKQVLHVVQVLCAELITLKVWDSTFIPVSLRLLCNVLFRSSAVGPPLGHLLRQSRGALDGLIPVPCEVEISDDSLTLRASLRVMFTKFC